MIRQHFIDHARMNKDMIEWRGHEISRIEAFSDAVFAFAVTLLIVALEVPENFHELQKTFSGFIGFGLGFLLLFNVWYAQNLFFRRYGLHDFRTVVLNGMLLFMVLFFVYPLKFVAVVVTQGNSYEEHGQMLQRIAVEDMPTLMAVYGAGFSSIFLLFTLMYRNVLKNAHHLNLNEVEMYETRTHLYRNMAFTGVGAITVFAALALPDHLAGASGILYALLGPATSILHSKRDKKARVKFQK